MHRFALSPRSLAAFGVVLLLGLFLAPPASASVSISGTTSVFVPCAGFGEGSWSASPHQYWTDIWWTWDGATVSSGGTGYSRVFTHPGNSSTQVEYHEVAVHLRFFDGPICSDALLVEITYEGCGGGTGGGGGGDDDGTLIEPE